MQGLTDLGTELVTSFKRKLPELMTGVECYCYLIFVCLISLALSYTDVFNLVKGRSHVCIFMVNCRQVRPEGSATDLNTRPEAKGASEATTPLHVGTVPHEAA